MRMSQMFKELPEHCKGEELYQMFSKTGIRLLIKNYSRPCFSKYRRYKVVKKAIQDSYDYTMRMRRLEEYKKTAVIPEDYIKPAEAYASDMCDKVYDLRSQPHEFGSSYDTWNK